MRSEYRPLRAVTTAPRTAAQGGGSRYTPQKTTAIDERKSRPVFLLAADHRKSMSTRTIDLRDLGERRCSDAEFREAQQTLRNAMIKFRNLTEHQRMMVAAACSHSYDCQCRFCLEWWALTLSGIQHSNE